MRTVEEVLREENAELKRLLREYEEQDDLVSLQHAFGLTRSQATILVSLLAAKKVASRDTIWRALYGSTANGPSGAKVLDVMVCHLRKKLPEGAEIKSQWGVGYFMPEASKVIVRGLVG